MEIPPELTAALQKNAPARGLFDKLSYSHKREYVQWIIEAKRTETRARRVAATIERLVR